MSRKVCYCKNVTEAEIIEHVAFQKCCSTIQDIQQHTGANTGTEYNAPQCQDTIFKI